MSVKRPLSPSLRCQVEGFQRDAAARGPMDDSWTKLRPGTSPAACTSPGSESLRTARPWTVSLASVKSFTSGSLAGESWSELLSRGEDGYPMGWLPGSIGPTGPTGLAGPTPTEGLNPRTELLSKSLVAKAKESCEEYRFSKREEDLRAFHGLWSNMSFRRPRGMDVLSERAKAARKPQEPLADGFVKRGPTGLTAAEIAKKTPSLQTLDNEFFVLTDRLIEADSMHFVSVLGGQVLYQEKDPVENAYILLSGSVQQYSGDHEFLRSMGWHPHVEHTEEDEKKRLTRQPSTRSHISVEDQDPEDDDYDPKSFSTLTEYVRKTGKRPDDTRQRFRTLEGHSAFCQESSYGNLYNTANADAIVGEGALKGEKAWRSTALCVKDCEFLVIDGTIFRQVLKSVRETHRFFELYLPGIRAVAPEKRKRPHPIEYWKREWLTPGETLLEEGMEPLEPFVFIVQQGKLELRRYRRSGANPAYILATQPLRGRPLRMATKEMASALPEIARSFVEDLDDDGLPRLGLPPPLKGSVRQKLESEYFRDPLNFIPDKIPKSIEGAKVYHHKVLLKERLESRETQRQERMMNREKAIQEAQQAAKDLDGTAQRSDKEVEEIRALMEYVQSISAARPGSPDYVGSDLWSDRQREWCSRELSTGPFSRPPSSQMITEPDARTCEDKQETVAVLKPGDVYCSLSFFPLCGVSEPFSVVSISADCCVAVVRGVCESKAIPKHILKEVRVDCGRYLQKQLGKLIQSTSKASKDSGIPAPQQKVVIAPEDEAPFFPGGGPAFFPDDGPATESPATHASGLSPGSLEGEMSVSLSRSLKKNDHLQVSQPLRDRPRSAESYSSSRRGNDEGGTGSNLNPFGLSEEPVSPAPRANGRGHKAAPRGPRPSFFRWLIYGKNPPKERRSILRCCWKS